MRARACTHTQSHPHMHPPPPPPHTQEKPEVARAVEQLASQLEQQMDSLDAQGIVNAAVGLAKLGYPTHTGLFDALTQCSMPHMTAGEMTAQGLSNLAWALATAVGALNLLHFALV